MVIVGDDCALPPPRGIAGRRGLAGTILVHKVLFIFLASFPYALVCTQTSTLHVCQHSTTFSFPFASFFFIFLAKQMSWEMNF